MPQPIFPTMSTEDPPSNEEIVGHNLACIAERLDTIAERLDNMTGMLERISGNLFDGNRRS